jgi:DNA-binding transcriptional regulator YhcF (GntR family)
MKWYFTSDRPIYLQLKEQIELLIISGEYVLKILTLRT